MEQAVEVVKRGGRGGKRAGAGRPKGSKNRCSLTAIELARETGDLPHEILLEVARGNVTVLDVVVVNGVPTEFERGPTPDERIRCAIGAAPYYAPKLAAQTVVVPAQPGENAIAELMRQIHEAPTSRVTFRKVRE